MMIEMTRHLVELNETNHQFLNRMRKEIMVENNLNIPLTHMVECCLVEFEKNNTEREMKEKLVHYKRFRNIL